MGDVSGKTGEEEMKTKYKGGAYPGALTISQVIDIIPNKAKRAMVLNGCQIVNGTKEEAEKKLLEFWPDNEKDAK